MRLDLGARWSKHLCEMPETGMGYQVVDVVLRSGERVCDVLVFNAQEVEWPTERGPIDPEDIVDIEAAAKS